MFPLDQISQINVRVLSGRNPFRERKFNAKSFCENLSWILKYVMWIMKCESISSRNVKHYTTSSSVKLKCNKGQWKFDLTLDVLRNVCFTIAVSFPWENLYLRKKGSECPALEETDNFTLSTSWALLCSFVTNFMAIIQNLPMFSPFLGLSSFYITQT